MSSRPNIMLRLAMGAVAGCCIQTAVAAEPPPVLPGHGYPGKIEPYDETAELKNKMAHNETVMDIENNAVGRMIGSGSYTNLIQVQNAVIDALNKGILTILDDLKNVNEIGLLQPSNQ